MDLQKRTRNAIVRPIIVLGPIEKESTLASLVISISSSSFFSSC